MKKNTIGNLRTGYTTGTCATAATVAALELLLNKRQIKTAKIKLPTGETAEIEIINPIIMLNTTSACVRKDSGDDPDITNGVIIKSTISFNNTSEINFIAGKGVGTITKAGLQIPIGQAAINPVPRKMMEKAVRELTDKGINITISVKRGEELAAKTFNPRLGIIGGISIIGTSGIVRPFSHEAIADTVKVNINVAIAQKIKRLVFVAGHYGMKAAQNFFLIDQEEIIEVSNEWNTALNHAITKGITQFLIISHPGKLAKFIDNHFNTHSDFSPSALPIVKRTATRLNIPFSNKSTTVEGLFQELNCNYKIKLANHLAALIKQAVVNKTKNDNISIILIDMQHNKLGSSYADFTDNKGNQWQMK